MKEYEEVRMDIIFLAAEDVITSSDEGEEVIPED